MKHKEERYKVNFGEYGIAAALYGNDVLKIFADESPRGHILIVDPRGHDVEKEKQVSYFLDEQIKKGNFGSSQNPSLELSKLSRLALKSKCPDFAASYVQLSRQNGLLLASAAFPFPIKFKSKKELLHKIDSVWGRYLPGYHDHHSSAYRIKLDKGDLLILTTDGVGENIETALGSNKRLLDGVRDQEREEIAKQDAKYLGEKVKNHHLQIIEKREQLFNNFFKTNAKHSAPKILETFIKTLGPMIIPKTKDDDDASIVIIKRN